MEDQEGLKVEEGEEPTQAGSESRPEELPEEDLKKVAGGGVEGPISIAKKFKKIH